MDLKVKITAILLIALTPRLKANSIPSSTTSHFEKWRNGLSTDYSKSYNFIANHRPRFRMPAGNLSILSEPNWELAYLLKYGRQLPPIENYRGRESLEKTDSLKFPQKTDGNSQKFSELLNFSPLITEELGEGSDNNKLLYTAVAEMNSNKLLRYLPHYYKKRSKKNVNFFLADHDPTWIRSRVAKEVGGYSRSMSNLYTVEKGELRSGFPAQLSIDESSSGKFQTQGWKKRK